MLAGSVVVLGKGSSSSFSPLSDTLLRYEVIAIPSPRRCMSRNRHARTDTKQEKNALIGIPPFVAFGLRELGFVST